MDVVFRAVFVFALLYVLMRVIGRRELSTLEPFDLILLVVLGDLVQQGVTQDDYSVVGIMLAIGTIGLLQLGVSFELPVPAAARSEEHTSELQSRRDLVCRLLLEKKKKKSNL